MTESLATAAVIALATWAIGWVYLTQYRERAYPRWLLVGVHFTAVSAIIVSYWWVAYRTYDPTHGRSLLSYAGWATFALGSIIFWWAALIHRTSLVPDEAHGLTAAGPYRWVRHPIYSSGILGAFGLLLVSPGPALAIDFVTLVAAMVLLSRSEEREIIGRMVGYAEYHARTGAFMPRPPAPGVAAMPRTRLAALVAISRVEYLAAGIFFLFLVAGLGAGSLEAMWEQRRWIALGCALWLFCHLLGSHVNCLSDYTLDARYKPALPRSIDMLGRRRVIALVAVESVAAAVIAAAFALSRQSWLPLALFATGWLLAMAYSVPPLRLKARGTLAPASLLAVLYALPVSFGYLALAARPDARVITFLGALALQMLAVILMNPVEDVVEDAQHGVRTPAVVHGVRAVAAAALVAYAAGAALALWAALALLANGPRTWTLIMVTGIGHIWVLGTLYRAWREGPAVLDSESARRRVGADNPRQFAVVGAAAAAVTASFLFP